MFRHACLFTVVFLSCGSAILTAQTPAAPLASPSAAMATASIVPTPNMKALVDSLDSADLKEAMQLLKEHYVKPELLSEAELNRATFEGVLIRLGSGVALLASSAGHDGGEAVPFFGEILEDHIGYLRIGALNPSNLDALDAKLKTFAAKNVDALVIDLRASNVANDFTTASEFAKRFCPKGKPLFSVRKAAAKQERTFTSDRDPAYEGLIIVLADGETAGAAEILGGVIRQYDKALVIGQPTAGRAAEYSDLKLPSGKVLRVAVSEAVLPGERSLFPSGLTPDVPVEMPVGDKREVFEQSREKGMTPFVVENERPHLNEAALISGKNPELEAMEASQRRGRSPEKMAVHDPVLQRALDLVTSITIFQRK